MVSMVKIKLQYLFKERFDFYINKIFTTQMYLKYLLVAEIMNHFHICKGPIRNG